MKVSENSRALTVSALNRQVKSLLEHSFLSIQVVGEISNFVRPSSGHWYFTLKDDRAQVRCAMFRNRNQRSGFIPKEGEEVVVTARVSLYEGRGDYQLICDQIEKSGLGQLQQAFDALKAKLQAEGLFDAQRKRPLPTQPRHIGVITSPTGAAIHDILTVLRRRFPGLPVTLYPSAVQGKEAAAELVRAIGLANRHGLCDVLIIGRGGGSLEDLWPFNEEAVARALADSAIPTVSAVGHEVDIAITDLVADHRAPTPSAAAELLSPDRHALQLRVNQLGDRLQSRVSWLIANRRQQLGHIRQRLRHPGERLREHAQRVDRLELRLLSSQRRYMESRRNQLTQLQARLLRESPVRRIETSREYVQQLEQRLPKLMLRQLEHNRSRLAQWSRQLHAVSPLATLERGYSILLTESGEALRNTDQVRVGDKINARLNEGELICTVDTINAPDSE
ncbi:exodeoxyribonuclease VII large subunit [Marinobacterium litorale]|uniref:exodeoxyribonuclease VII large subunit n=1 Tax=Marinobacterium litorale TaxID=404770 RepID=UPI0004117C3E|nr:exodeoxyribonuclease VII large subunit [Marinobacterium litorale]